MKKILSCVMALSLAASAAMSVSAAQQITSGTTEGQTILNSVQDPAYTVIIPDAEVNVTGETTMTVDAQNVKIGDEQNLKLTVESKNNFEMKCGTDAHSVSYDLYKGDTSSGTKLNDAPTTALISTKSVADVDDVTLTIANLNTTKATCAGKYTDTLTFTVAVDND